MQLSELKKIEWDRYAVRQFNFFYFSAILEGYKYYTNFVNKNFDCTMVKYTPLDRVYFRNKKKRIEIEEFIERNVKKLSFAKKFAEKVEKQSNKAIKENRVFHNKEISAYSNKKLIKEFKKLMKTNCVWVGGISANIMLITKVSDFIQNKIILPKLKKKKRQKDLNETMGTISFPKKLYYKQEELDLIKVAEEKNQKKFNKLLSEHAKKYSIIHYFNTCRLIERKDFLKRIKTLRKNGLQKEKKRILNFLEGKEKEIKEICKDLGLSQKETEFIELLRKILFLRVQEEYILTSIEFTFDKVFRETVKRFPLSLNQLKFFILPELYDLYEGKKVDLVSVNKRNEFVLLIFSKGKQFVFTDEKAKKAFKVAVKEISPEKFTGILKGTSATKGKAKGKARIVFHISHITGFKKGRILVAPNTNPAYVPAMKKASAIITDEGGVTCHAAIVSRELGVPCVIGTKFATSLLKNNDLLYVNATEGIIKRMK
ncbi:hypothetical protein KKG83_06675 [Candidatus Micrarchaeota archaeon]|nr:hypothetical protein [Candidatus Micrarchaeota archaeon]MBU2477127.1 hypothetical protein [Candidatus Micrarchaeota archaeon]